MAVAPGDALSLELRQRPAARGWVASTGGRAPAAAAGDPRGRRSPPPSASWGRWRHFVHHPTPAKLLQDTAPATFVWTGRTWAARGSAIGDRPLLDSVPVRLAPLLGEIGATHLQALDPNAEAHARGVPMHDLTVQGTTYPDVPTSAYRVSCLEQLRARFDALPSTARSSTEALLGRHGCWEPLWRASDPASGHDPRGGDPLCRVLRMVRD